MALRRRSKPTNTQSFGFPTELQDYTMPGRDTAAGYAIAITFTVICTLGLAVLFGINIHVRRHDIGDWWYEKRQAYRRWRNGEPAPQRAITNQF